MNPNVLRGIAQLLLVGGLLVGLFLPVSSEGYDCGSPFMPANTLGFTDTGCETAISSSRTLPFILIVLGAVGWVAAQRLTNEREDATEASDES